MVVSSYAPPIVTFIFSDTRDVLTLFFLVQVFRPTRDKLAWEDASYVTVRVTCARLSDSIVGTSRAKIRRARFGKAFARFSHFFFTFLLNDFSPLSWSLEQPTVRAKLTTVIIVCSPSFFYNLWKSSGKQRRRAEDQYFFSNFSSHFLQLIPVIV